MRGRTEEPRLRRHNPGDGIMEEAIAPDAEVV